MPITLLTNVAALQTQRQLARTSKELFQNFERLSSGLRINRASDDAAGLSIAEALRVDARVFAQGIRNANDGISLLNIAEGSVSELSSILTRMLELAEQSANGVYSGRQREALHSESDSLRKEYNRIVVSTEFNKRSILTSAQEELRFQLGYGTNGSIGFSITEDLERNVGAGSFSSTTVNTLNPNSNRAVASGDINGSRETREWRIWTKPSEF